jgi:hypothetical protein
VRGRIADAGLKVADQTFSELVSNALAGGQAAT